MTNLAAHRSERLRSSETCLGNGYARRLEEGHSGRCQGDMSAVPLQERCTELILKSTDALAESRLGYVQPLGGSPEMEVLGNSNEASERSDIHGCVIRFPYHRVQHSNWIIIK
jgi:hypothetical protein